MLRMPSSSPAMIASPPTPVATAANGGQLPLSAPGGQPSGAQNTVGIPLSITLQTPKPPQLEWWEVQGVLPSIAAVIAVVLTAISLHWNTTRSLRAAKQNTEAQLENARLEAQREREHAARESQRDRLTEARKAVYSDLINDYRAVQEVIGGLATIDLDKVADAHKPVAAMNASVTKLWIWSEVETAREIREFHSQLSEMFFDALALCAPIFEQRRSIRAHWEEASKASERHQSMQERLHELNYTAELGFNPQLMARRMRLQKLETEFLKQSVDHQSQARSESSELMKKTADYAEYVVARQATLMKQLNKVMAAARAELGIGGDASILETQSTEIGARAAAALAKFKFPRE